MIRFGHFRKTIRNTHKVLKCGAGKEWKSSFGPIMWEIRYHII
jgi:hypothetical protein